MPRSRAANPGPPTRNLVPPDGIVPVYLRAAADLSPAPPLYHIVSLLTVLSAVVCPSTVLVRRSRARPRIDLLHIWSILCGPPNNGKSYSAKMARRVASKILRGRILAPIGSLQGLEAAIVRVPNAFFFADEFSRFLSENRASWMRGNGAQFWCQVFDGRILTRNLSGADEDRGADDPAKDDDGVAVRVSMLGAAATESIVAALKPSDWGGGLMSRAVFATAGRNNLTDDWFDWPEQVQVRLEEQVEEIHQFARQTPEIGWDPTAYELYLAWFLSTEEAIGGFGPVQADSLARLTRHVRVICALYAASCRSRTVLPAHVRAACALGDVLKFCLLSLPVPRTTSR